MVLDLQMDKHLRAFLKEREKAIQAEFDKALAAAVKSKYDAYDDDFVKEYEKAKKAGKPPPEPKRVHRMIKYSQMNTIVDQVGQKINKAYGQILHIHWDHHHKFRTEKSKIKGYPPLVFIESRVVVEVVDFKSGRAGGGTYTTKPGETLAQIAERVYGNPLFADAILEYNKGLVLQGGRFLMARELRLPVMSVPYVITESKVKSALPAPNALAKLKMLSEHPDIKITHNPKVPLAKGVKAQGPIVMIYVLYAGGQITFRRKGPIPARFSIDAYKKEVLGVVKSKSAFSWAIDYLDSGKATVTSNFFGKATLSGSIAPKPGTFTLKGTTPPFTKKIAGFEVTGSSEVTLEVTVAPNPRWREAPVEGPLFERIWDYKWHGIPLVAIAGLAISGAGVAIIIGTELGAGVAVGGLVAAGI